MTQYLFKSADRYNTEVQCLLALYSSILTRNIIDDAYHEMNIDPAPLPKNGKDNVWDIGKPGYFIYRLRKIKPEFRILYYFEQCPKFALEKSALCLKYHNQSNLQNALCHEADNHNQNACKGIVYLLAIDTRKEMDRRYKRDADWAIKLINAEKCEA